MSRPLRIQFPGAWYHVMHRGQDRRTVFGSTEAFNKFEELLHETWDRFDLEIHAYCLMTNHYHLLVRTPQGNLSRGMRHLNGVYTQWHNRRRSGDGPIFRGRYHALLVDADSHLLTVSRYIHRNPIETRQPLVQNLADYPWSSFPAYAGRSAAPDFLHKYVVLRLFSTAQSTLTYPDYVAADTAHDENTTNTGKMRPETGYSARLPEQTRIETNAGSTEISDTQRRALLNLSVDTIVLAVSQVLAVDVGDIVCDQRLVKCQSSLFARDLAVYLCHVAGGYTLPHLCQKFGVQRTSTLSEAVRRCRYRLNVESKPQCLYKMLIKRLGLAVYEQQRHTTGTEV